MFKVYCRVHHSSIVIRFQIISVLCTHYCGLHASFSLSKFEMTCFIHFVYVMIILHNWFFCSFLVFICVSTQVHDPYFFLTFCLNHLFSFILAWCFSCFFNHTVTSYFFHFQDTVVFSVYDFAPHSLNIFSNIFFDVFLMHYASISSSLLQFWNTWFYFIRSYSSMRLAALQIQPITHLFLNARRITGIAFCYPAKLQLQSAAECTVCHIWKLQKCYSISTEVS